jgi:hypothetical protein
MECLGVTGKKREQSVPDPAPDEPELLIPEDPTQAQEAAALAEQISHALNRPDLIRQRAQNSAAICGAAATALAAFAALSGLERGTEALITLGLALSFWLVSMVVFIHAITYSETHARKQAGDGPKTLPELVSQFRTEAALLRAHVHRGRWTTWAAAALTIAAVVLLVSGISDATKVHVLLTDKAASAITRVCDWSSPQNPVEARLATSSLDKRFVALEVSGCSGKQRTVRLHNTSILATRR